MLELFNLAWNAIKSNVIRFVNWITQLLSPKPESAAYSHEQVSSSTPPIRHVERVEPETEPSDPFVRLYRIVHENDSSQKTIELQDGSKTCVGIVASYAMFSDPDDGTKNILFDRDGRFYTMSSALEAIAIPDDYEWPQDGWPAKITSQLNHIIETLTHTDRSPEIRCT